MTIVLVITFALILVVFLIWRYWQREQNLKNRYAELIDRLNTIMKPDEVLPEKPQSSVKNKGELPGGLVEKLKMKMKAQLSYYQQEVEKLTLYHDDHIEFYSYYRRGATYLYLDQKYFLRRMYDLKMSLPSALYNYNESFTTSHDHHIAQIMTYQEIEKLRQYGDSNYMAPFSIVWSESQVSLVELIYGLYQLNCFNGGSIELSEVIKFTEKSFDISLGNYHKTIFEIRTRKN